jgi:hypothetical protein
MVTPDKDFAQGVWKYFHVQACPNG